jgi:hypothetical protein
MRHPTPSTCLWKGQKETPSAPEKLVAKHFRYRLLYREKIAKKMEHEAFTEDRRFAASYRPFPERKMTQ